MRASRKDKVIIVLKITKTQVEVVRELYKSQLKLACTTTEKAVSELIDCYVVDEELLI